MERFISEEQSKRQCSLCLFYSFHHQSDNNKNTHLFVQSINYNIPSLLRHVFHPLRLSFLPSQLPLLLLLLLRTNHLNTHSSSSSSSRLLHSCKDLQTLKQAHASLIVSKGFLPISVASTLMSFYAQFHDFHSVVRVFNTLEEPHTIAWNLDRKSVV